MCGTEQTQAKTTVSGAQERENIPNVANDKQQGNVCISGNTDSVQQRAGTTREPFGKNIQLDQYLTPSTKVISRVL